MADWIVENRPQDAPLVDMAQRHWRDADVQ